MEYQAPMDLKIKIITTLVIVITIGSSGYGYILSSSMSSSSHDNLTSIFSLLPLLTIVLLLGIIYLFKPQKYIVGDGKLIVKRIISDKEFQLDQITEASEVTPEEWKGTIRTMGVGGFFGYWGKFVNNQLGAMTVYATQSKNKIKIRFKDKKIIVITPADTTIISELTSTVGI